MASTYYQQKGFVTRHTHLKYEGHEFYQLKDMVNVKVFADKQTDNLTNGQKDGPKTTCPRSIDAGAQKLTLNKVL